MSFTSRFATCTFNELLVTVESVTVSFPVTAEVAGIKEENEPKIKIRTATRDLVAFENKVPPSSGLSQTPLNTSIIGQVGKIPFTEW